MSFDSIASLQRIQQMKQAEAANGNRLVLQRMNSKLDIVLTIAAFILVIPTLTVSIWLLMIYLIIKSLTSKTYLVKNVANGEKFRVQKNDFKKYKKEVKNKEGEIKNISDIN